MLREAIHMLHPWEAEVKGDGLWAMGFAVSMAFEGFLPPPFWITFLHMQDDMTIFWGLSWQYAAIKKGLDDYTICAQIKTSQTICNTASCLAGAA